MNIIIKRIQNSGGYYLELEDEQYGTIDYKRYYDYTKRESIKLFKNSNGLRYCRNITIYDLTKSV